MAERHPAKILETFPEMNPIELDTALDTVRSKYQPEDSTNLEGLLFPATYRVERATRSTSRSSSSRWSTKFDAVGDRSG